MLVSWPEDLNQVPWLGVTRVCGVEPFDSCHLKSVRSGHARFAEQAQCKVRQRGKVWDAHRASAGVSQAGRSLGPGTDTFILRREHHPLALDRSCDVPISAGPWLGMAGPAR